MGTAGSNGTKPAVREESRPGGCVCFLITLLGLLEAFG